MSSNIVTPAATAVPLPDVDTGQNHPANLSQTTSSSAVEQLSKSDADKRKADAVLLASVKSKRPRLLRPCDRPGYGDERFNETSYYFENGLRKVRPYYFTFTTYCKGRWINRKLIDVFAQEFRAQPVSEFERCIEQGNITVNSEKVTVDYIMQDGDLVANKSHRHEIPVSDEAIKIVHQSDDLLVIDKPSSIPVHPCGRYRHNSVIFILGKEHGFRNIRTIHRIDRLTSGLLLLGLSTERARELEKQMSGRQVEKEYICEVDGQFPSEKVTCSEPIDVLSFKIGICFVGVKGKQCQTDFECMSSDGKTSIVLCKPHTGRMHQIRVHLQYLGFPIVNDPIYNHTVFGPNRGKNGEFGKSQEQLVEDLLKTHTTEAWLGEGGRVDLALGPPLIPLAPDGKEIEKSRTDDNVKNGADDSALAKEVADSPVVDSAVMPSSEEKVTATYDPHCADCNRRVVFRDPRPSDLVMYLHCWKYKGPNWSFQTKIPFWAEGKIKDP